MILENYCLSEYSPTLLFLPFFFLEIPLRLTMSRQTLNFVLENLKIRQYPNSFSILL